jgi:hypothetical protein
LHRQENAPNQLLLFTGASVTHEEVMCFHNQEGLDLERFVVNEESHNMETSVNTHELGHTVKCMDFGSCEPASIACLRAFDKAETAVNTNVRIGSLESLLGPSFDARPLDNGIFLVHTDQQQAESNLSLKNLLSGNISHSTTNVGNEIRGAGETLGVGRVTNDAMNTILAESQGDGQLGSDEVISTPVVLESLLEQEEPFDLLSYVFNEVSYQTSIGGPVEEDCKKKSSTSCSRSWQRTSSSSVPDESWTPSSKRLRMSSGIDRCRERRDRNNEACRKSRLNRKARENEMREVAAKLERENKSLKMKLDAMEQLVMKLTEALLKAQGYGKN